MSVAVDNLSWLQALYDSFTGDEWEEDYGCQIDTLDNPGWSFKFDLRGTPLIDVPFEELLVERSDRDWLQCRIREQRFEGFGGPLNLDEVLTIFRKWVEGRGIQVLHSGAIKS